MQPPKSADVIREIIMWGRFSWGKGRDVSCRMLNAAPPSDTSGAASNYDRIGLYQSGEMLLEQNFVTKHGGILLGDSKFFDC